MWILGIMFSYLWMHSAGGHKGDALLLCGKSEKGKVFVYWHTIIGGHKGGIITFGGREGVLMLCGGTEEVLFLCGDTEHKEGVISIGAYRRY